MCGVAPTILYAFFACTAIILFFISAQILWGGTIYKLAAIWVSAVMLTAHDKLSCDSRQKLKQRNHSCFKHFNIVCGHKTVAHLSLLRFWEDFQCSAMFASVSEAILENWHRRRSEGYKERINFEYWGPNVSQTLLFPKSHFAASVV